MEINDRNLLFSRSQQESGGMVDAQIWGFPPVVHQFGW